MDHSDIQATRLSTIACAKCGAFIDVASIEPFSETECPSCHTRQKVPAQLGSFLLVEPLGMGGMGAVYRGLDQALGRFVAIKVMKKQLGDDPSLVESFLREARAAAALNHKNIVQIYSCGQENGQPYIVMELVAGGRLDQMMADGKKVDEARMLQVALDVAEGLSAANKAGLVHGDIKPANILFDKSGTAKVVDFGLAQFVNRQQSRGEIWGTPYYISPERARGGMADHRSDIYSLGATMYHALTGKPPFDGKTAGDVVVARLKNPPPDVRVLEPDITPQTAALLLRMMEPDTSRRYPTSASLRADMSQALLAAQTMRGGGASGGEGGSGKGKFVAIAVALVVVAGALAAMLMRKKPEPPPPHRPPPVVTATTATSAPPPAAAGDAKYFFTGEAEARLVAALSQLAGPRPMAAYDQLEAALRDIPRHSARAMWIRVLQALPCWIDQQDGRADDLLREVSGQPVKLEKGHPVHMPQVLARYMLGELDDSQMNEEQTRWPEWYGDLAQLYLGLRSLREGKFDKARGLLDAYMGSEGVIPAWAYAMRPAVGQWLNDVDDVAGMKPRIARRLGNREFKQAREDLDDLRGRVPPILHPSLDQLAAEVKEAEKASIAEARPPEEKPVVDTAKEGNIQADLNRIDEALTANMQVALTRKDYRAATERMAAVAAELKTNEGREALQIVRDQYARMDSLKSFLSHSVGAEPFRQVDGTELGGDVVGAGGAGLKISLGDRGEFEKPWEQVSVRTMLRMANYYLGQGRLPDQERADMLLSLSVFCFCNGGFDLAANLAGQAVKLNPDLKTPARRLMPDLVAD
jgi:uncharacterized protein YneF (UPF0154 family)